MSRTAHRRICATAPIRILDNGGWTDTWAAQHGKVFNIAVRPLVEVRIDVFPGATRDARVVINVADYGMRYAPLLNGSSWGPHPLLEAALRSMPPRDHIDLEITVRSKAPPGAGTGTSAAVVVALLGALDRLGDGCRSADEIATMAHAVEARQLGRQCGVQDQICSAFGGINFIEIVRYPEAIVSRVDAAESTLRELDHRLAVIYLGRPHSSSAVHEQVMQRLEHLGSSCAQLEALRRAAEEARDAVRAGDLDALGRAMCENTNAQAGLHTDLVHRDAWRVIEIAAAHGANGWKVNGAGGEGGSVTLLCDPRPAARRATIRAIMQANPAFAAIPVTISHEGLSVISDT